MCTIVAFEAAKDTESSVAFYTDDAIIQVAGAPQIRGREAISDLYRSLFDEDQLTSFEAASSHIETSGHLGLDYGTYRMVMAGSDGDLIDAGKYLAVWKRISGEWFISVLSFTSDTPAPDAAAQ
jgi:ketosteroid isomerase-like protein